MVKFCRWVKIRLGSSTSYSIDLFFLVHADTAPLVTKHCVVVDNVEVVDAVDSQNSFPTFVDLVGVVLSIKWFLWSTYMSFEADIVWETKIKMRNMLVVLILPGRVQSQAWTDGEREARVILYDADDLYLLCSTSIIVVVLIVVHAAWIVVQCTCCLMSGLL